MEIVSEERGWEMDINFCYIDCGSFCSELIEATLENLSGNDQGTHKMRIADPCYVYV